MRSFFISPSPRFKNAKQPDKKGVEESPYFWWWYALTLNAEYRALCEQKDAGRARRPKTASEKAMHQLYKDWGDVRFKGDRYVAFTKWFTRPIGKGQTVGALLFGEPPLEMSVRLVKSGADAEALLANGGAFLIAIPRRIRRNYLDKRLNAIFKKDLVVVKGRAVRDPRTSRALYHLAKAAVPATLKKAFDLYDAREAAKAAGEKLSNYDCFKSVGLKYTQKVKDEEKLKGAAKRRVISMLVSRHIKNANAMIRNAGLAQFP
jgi:hypothetical protein